MPLSSLKTGQTVMIQLNASTSDSSAVARSIIATAANAATGAGGTATNPGGPVA